MEHEFPTENTLNNLTEFKFPANIKQMGNSDRELKIYLEDYVYTYLYQYARTGGGGEKLAVLVGKHYEVDGIDISEVSGSIEARYTEICGDKISFTEESWNYINRQLELYFKGLCVIGWVHIQPDYGTYLMPNEEAFHKECFKEKWQLLFIVDPSERLDAFYCIKQGEAALRQTRGYFIYYDKNENMQNYMIENSLIKPKVEKEDEGVISMASGKAAVARLLGITRQKAEICNEKNEDEEEKPDKPVERIDAAGKIRKVLREKQEIKDKEAHNRQIALTAVCAALCLASVMMSSNLINNMSRIKNLEKELMTMKTSYDSMSRMVEEATAQVFAVKNTNFEVSEKANEPKEKKEEPEKTENVENNNISSEDIIYSVEEGDSLLYISKKFYGTGNMVSRIMEANNLSNENVIFSGDKLIIPKE